MSKPIKDLKKRMKAPRNLVEATKRGERLESTYTADTSATHVGRFSLALVGYACIAALMLGSVIVLPNLLRAQPPVAQSGTTETMQPEGYVKPTEEEAKGFFHPDLIWASHVNPQLSDFVIWAAERGKDGVKVTTPLTHPDVGEDTSAYAVEIRLEYLRAEGGEQPSISAASVKRQYSGVVNAMKEFGVETLKNQYGDDSVYGDLKPLTGENPYFSMYYALGQDQFTEEVENALLAQWEYLPENTRIEIKIAWQPNSVMNDYEERLVWAADQVDGVQSIQLPMTLPQANGENEEYLVRIIIEDQTDAKTMSGAAVNVYKRQDSQMEDALKAAGFKSADVDVETLWPKNGYYGKYYTVSRKDLNAFDSAVILSSMSEVDIDMLFSIEIMVAR